MPLVWADNADAISKEYAGTGALKTDFTRYSFSFCMEVFSFTIFAIVDYILWVFLKTGHSVISLKRK